MNNKVAKNFIYNSLYQILTIIIPLILMPYLSRVLGASGVGLYSYTYSIVYYFMMLCLLGVNNYGNRTIAQVKNDKEKLSKTFFEIYFFQLMMGVTMLLLYCSYLFLFDINYKVVSYCQLLFIVSAMLDINWFYFGLEEFKITVTRNSLVKLLSVFLVFILVKKPSDVWIYTLIISGCNVLSQAFLWLNIKKYISLQKVKLNDIKKHIKPNLVLFIPIIAISIYKMMDKIMLGFFTNVTEVGYYENAEKIISFPFSFINALGLVMLPHMSAIIKNEGLKKISNKIGNSIKFVMFLSFAMCLGLVPISQNFSIMFFGEEFAKTGLLIQYLALTIPILAFANVIRTQYLIPIEKDKIYVISVGLGAIINLIFNIIFIPRFKSIGACFGTIAAEFAVMFYQAFAIRKELPIKEYIMNSIPFLIKSLIMLIIIYPFNYLEMNSLARLIIQVGLGCLVYGLLNIKYILSIVDIKKIINKIFKKKSISQ